MSNRGWQLLAGRRVWFVAVSLTATAVGLFGWWTFVQSWRPNVLLITLDTTRADRLGCYGYPSALTPTLDALAAEGVLFERAYTPAPLTLPSHASMMTGLYPPEHGLVANGTGRLDASIPTLAEAFRDAGYDTGAFVGSFVLHSKFGLERGFSIYDDDMTNTDPAEDGLHRQRDGQHVVDSALAWLKQRRICPFFGWVHLYDAHRPYVGHTDEFGDRFEDTPYDAEIAYVDRQVARLVKHLRDNQLWERTLVLVVGDHGESLGEHGEEEHGLTLYDCVVRVPWLWAGFGSTAAGRRAPQPVSLADLRPTVLAAVGLEDRARSSGRSLAAALAGGEIAPANCYSATDLPLIEHGWAPLRSLTTVAWKYIRSPKVELYDLSTDPTESHNVAANQPDRVRELEHELAALEQTFAVPRRDAVKLSSRERKALESLGYLGGGNARPYSVSDDENPDVKQMLPLHNAINRAREKIADGNPGAAEEESRRVLADAPDFAEAELVLAVALIAQSNFSEARQVLDRALERNPEQIGAHFQIGMIEKARGHHERALEHFLRELELKPGQQGVLYNLGLTLIQHGREQEAQRYFKEALELDPTFANAHIGLGMALALDGRDADAERHYRAALAYDAKAVEAHLNLGILLMGESRLTDAREHLASAARLAPDNSECRFSYGMWLLQSGRLDDAIAEFSETLKLEPDHAKAEQRLQQARDARGR